MALGLKRLQIFRYIVLKPALRAIYPALTSQFILLMLASSIVSAISAEELTSIANKIAIEDVPQLRDLHRRDRACTSSWRRRSDDCSADLAPRSLRRR